MDKKACLNLKYILPVGIIVFFILFFFVHPSNNPSLFDLMLNILKRNFGDFQVNVLLKPAFSLSIFSSFVFIISLIVNCNLPQRYKISKWFLFSLSLMFFFLISGFLLTDLIGVQYIRDWNLQNSSGNYGFGTIDCFSPNGDYLILAEQESICDFKTDLIIMPSYKVVQGLYKNNTFFRFEPGGQENSYRISFNASKDIKYIAFFLIGNNTKENNTGQIYSVSYPHTFLTLEDYEQNKKTFLNYLIAIFTIILITIPISLNEWKKLWRGTD